jgi:hypothetical protein
MMKHFRKRTSVAANLKLFKFAMFFFFTLLTPFFVPAQDISVKGVRLGMHVEHARQQMLVRTEKSLVISPMQRASSGALFFDLNGTEGRVMGDSRARVASLYFSEALTDQFFEASQFTTLQFTWLLSKLWKLDQDKWQVTPNTLHPSMPSRVGNVMEYFCPETRISVRISDRNALTISRLSPRHIRQFKER